MLHLCCALCYIFFQKFFFQKLRIFRGKRGKRIFLQEFTYVALMSNFMLQKYKILKDTFHLKKIFEFFFFLCFILKNYIYKLTFLTNKILKYFQTSLSHAIPWHVAFPCGCIWEHCQYGICRQSTVF